MFCLCKGIFASMYDKELQNELVEDDSLSFIFDMLISFLTLPSLTEFHLHHIPYPPITVQKNTMTQCISYWRDEWLCAH